MRSEPRRGGMFVMSCKFHHKYAASTAPLNPLQSELIVLHRHIQERLAI